MMRMKVMVKMVMALMMIDDCCDGDVMLVVMVKTTMG